MNPAFRIKSGHVSKATIDADSNSILQNFPMQTDMGAIGALWNCNLMVARHASVRTPLSARSRGQGYFGLSLNFDMFTFGMNSYWLATLFATVNEYGLVTVKVYSEIDGAKYYQGVMQKGNFQTITQNAIGYQDNVRWPIIQGVEIT